MEICVFLADLGMARQLLPGRMASTWCGTPAYIAPEVFTLPTKYDEKVNFHYDVTTAEPEQNVLIFNIILYK
jgi:serine/threonine protein kinase